MKFSFFLISILISAPTYAVIDMKSANFAETFTDISVPGVGYDLRVTRTYNSRSIFNGIFGFGWCSDFETKVEVTPESGLKLTECGAGMETAFLPAGFKANSSESVISQVVAALKKKRPDLKPEYLNSLAKEMTTNDFMREEFARRLDIKGSVKDGTKFFANGKEAENILLKSGTYKRTLTDGTYQIFDAASGRLTHMYDRNGNYLKLTWGKDGLANVVDNTGKKLTFKLDPTSKKVALIVGPNKLVASYSTNGDDLVEVKDAENQVHKYKYDELHNLVRMDLPDKTHKELTYNKDRDWVMSFRNPKGCVETYNYSLSKEDPKGYFKSEVLKKCGKEVTNKSTYEFYHKPRVDGLGLYLHRVKTVNNGEITDIVYHPVFGKPLTVVEDGVKTEYSYYANGFVQRKKDSSRSLSYEYKDKKCQKVSRIFTEFIQPVEAPVTKNSKKSREVSGEKVLRKYHTDFKYDQKKCNLVYAENSEGQKVRLSYDPRGRIAKIEDQSKKIVDIKYEEKFGKPSVVSRVGLGTIQVTYKSDGQIDKVDSKQGPEVAVQVATVFNNLLDIIAPATSESPL